MQRKIAIVGAAGCGLYLEPTARRTGLYLEPTARKRGSIWSLPVESFGARIKLDRSGNKFHGNGSKAGIL
jgi:hypothetical protein